MGLSNDKGFFSFASKNQEFNGLFLGSLRFTMISYHLSTLWKLTLASENMLCFVNVPQMLKVNSNNIFPVIGSFIHHFGFFEIPICLLGFSNHDQDWWGSYLVHERLSCLEHFHLDVNANSLFSKTSFLIEFGSFLPLFHVFANACNFYQDIFLIYIASNTITSLYVTHLDGCSGNTSVALCVMLFHINLIICIGILVKECFLV